VVWFGILWCMSVGVGMIVVFGGVLVLVGYVDCGGGVCGCLVF